MAVHLVRALGPRAMTRVLRALGELRDTHGERAQGQPGGPVVGRKRFLQIGAGIAVAAGLTFAGRSPAFAQSEASRARSWAQANAGKLPQSYAEIVRQPLEYRRAIFTKSSPSVRSRLWLEHLSEYRLSHPDLSPAQHEAINKAVDVFSDESVFQEVRGADVDRRLAELLDVTVAAFGKDEAKLVIATLGPAASASTAAAPVPDCECSTSSSPWCSCYAARCPGWFGCGAGWIYWCNGYCP